MSDRPDPDIAERVVPRRVLFDVAYRLLGSVTDAEDAVQEAYLRWYRLDPAQRATIESVTGWFVRTTSRICLDVLRSAHHRRQQYVGDWLPEPLPAGVHWRSDDGASAAADPADRVTLDESVSTALLVVLDTLTPAERVAFVLHDVFGHPFDEIAEIVGRSPAACRQLATSARRRIRDERPARTAGAPDAGLVAAVKTAWESGDVRALSALLAPDVVAVTDSGGLVSAPPGPVRGAVEVARLLVEVPRRQPGLSVHLTSVNGQPGLEARAGGVTLAVISLRIAADRIDRLWIVRNPMKLHAWRRGRVG